MRSEIALAQIARGEPIRDHQRELRVEPRALDLAGDARGRERAVHGAAQANGDRRRVGDAGLDRVALRTDDLDIVGPDTIERVRMVRGWRFRRRLLRLFAAVVAPQVID